MKRKLGRDKSYLAWLRRHPCCVTGIAGDEVVAHHVRLGNDCGMGLKPSDYRTIPITVIAHAELHHIGEARFYKKFRLDPDRIIAKYLFDYLSEQGMARQMIDWIEDMFIMRNSLT